MSVFLSPIGNGHQYLSVASQLATAVGGTFNTYLAGTATPYATFTSSAGNVNNPVSIAIGANGTLPNPVWIGGGIAIKIIILDALSNAIGPTYDNIYGINDPSSGSTAPATAVSYTPPGTGGLVTTVAAELGHFVWVTDYAANGVSGARVDPTGSIESSLGFQAAHNALGATGGIIGVPPGTYNLASGNVSFTNPVILRGCGIGSSIIKTSSGTGAVIVLNAAKMGIEHIGFDTSVTRTSGPYISLTKNCSNSFVRKFYLNAGFVGITGTCINTVKIEDGTIFGTATGGYGIRLLGDGVTAAGNDIYLTKITISSGSNVATAGIEITNNGAINITDCDVIQHGTSLLIDPNITGGQAEVASSIYCLNSYFDTATNGLFLNPGASGTIQGFRAVGCWFSNHSNVGITVGSTGTVVGCEFISPYVFSNAANGIVISGGTDIRFIGGGSCGSSAGSGASIAANVSGWSFIGMRMGSGYGKPVNAGDGIFVAVGTSGNFSIIGCDLTGNTGGSLVDNGSGGGKNVYGNVGIDPGPTSNISVTGSPFTYTAGDRPETIYVNGGTVSIIAVDGTNVFQQTNQTVRLGAGKSVVVTYSMLPGMAKTIE